MLKPGMACVLPTARRRYWIEVMGLLGSGEQEIMGHLESAMICGTFE